MIGLIRLLERQSLFMYNPGSSFSLGHAAHRFGCAPMRLLSLFLLLLTACSSQPDPEQIARVEQNFDKIQPGMTKEQVRKLVGEPFKVNENFELTKGLGCNSCELWLLVGSIQDIKWPHVVFDRTTNRVTKRFEEEPDEYFLF